MSERHTQGRIRYDYEPGYCGELLAENGTSLCTFTDEPSEANARRLVACWNACDGIGTEALERLGTLDRARVELDVIRTQAIAERDHFKALAQDNGSVIIKTACELADVKAQRHELLHALNLIRESEVATHSHEYCKAISRAAIAKAEGGAA